MKKTVWWRQNRFSCAQEIIVRQSAAEMPANNLNPWMNAVFVLSEMSLSKIRAFLQSTSCRLLALGPQVWLTGAADFSTYAGILPLAAFTASSFLL